MNRKILCLNPLVAVIDDHFGPEVAEAAIAAGRDTLGPVKVANLLGETLSDKRTNRATFVDVWAHPALSGLAESLSDIVRLPPENADKVKLLHYCGQEKFDVHHDAYQNDLYGAQQLRNGGQRLFTTICYLNDVAEGGETVFPELKLAVRPQAGRVLVFANTVPGTAEPHPHALHAGTPVKSGEKWVLSLWWRQFPYIEIRDFPATVGAITVV